MRFDEYFWKVEPLNDKYFLRYNITEKKALICCKFEIYEIPMKIEKGALRIQVMENEIKITNNKNVVIFDCIHNRFIKCDTVLKNIVILC